MTLQQQITKGFQAVAADIKSLRGSSLTKPSLLVYYGYPIAFRGMWSVPSVVAAISEYDYYICGDTYSDPAHEEYASTTQIITQLRAAGTKVYGYVPIGVTTSNLTAAQIKTKIDQWVALNVDGIFLDEFGFDYHVPRTRQIDIVNYVHSKGKPYVANAWIFEDVACDNVNQLPWPSNDWRYNNFTTYNPNNLPLARTLGDTYLIENFCYDNTQALNEFDAQERYMLIRTRNKALPVPLVIWAVSVFGENPTSSGIVDQTKIGTLPLADVPNYIVANAWIFDIDVLGVGGFSFGAASTPVLMTMPPLPTGTRITVPNLNAPVVNLTTAEFSRRIDDHIVINCTNKPPQTVTITNSSQSPIATVPKSTTPQNPAFTDKRVYTNVAGQTAFALTYNPPFAHVYVNGFKLPASDDNSDYQATNGTTVVLAAPIQNADDVVELVGFSSFSMADTYSTTAIDSKFAVVDASLAGKAPLDLSNAAVVDAGTLDGTEIIPAYKSGYKKTTLQKVINWLFARTNTWTARQNFNNPVLSQMNTGQLAGIRNKIENGKMSVSQKGDTFSAANLPGTSMIDRWSFSRSGGTAVITGARSTDVPANTDFQYSASFTVTTGDSTAPAASSFSTFRQLIEGYNSRDLRGKTFVLSFWVKSSKVGSYSIAMRNNAATSYYIATYSIAAANTWEFKTIVVSGGIPTTGTWETTDKIGLRVNWMLSCGSDFRTATTAAWTTGSMLASTNQVNFLDTTNNVFLITGVQLEVGPVASSFEHLPYPVELQLCQRHLYHFVNGSANTYYCSPVTAFSATRILAPLLNTPTIMRTMSSVAFSGVSIYSSSSNLVNPVTTMGIYSGQAGNYTFDVSIASGMTAGTVYLPLIAANGFISISAELS